MVWDLQAVHIQQWTEVNTWFSIVTLEGTMHPHTCILRYEVQEQALAINMKGHAVVGTLPRSCRGWQANTSTCTAYVCLDMTILP